jgi:nucleotide-binding universal stress UspA family protein
MPIEPMGPVIVGVGRSVASMTALDLAAEEAMGRVVPLLVVHVRDGQAVDDVGMGTATLLLDLAVSRACADHPSLSVTPVLVAGRPADVLVDRSRGASLLVVGHRGRCGSRESRVGSVAQQVAGRARVPVIVSRPLDPSVPTRWQPRPVLVGVSGMPGDDGVVEFAFAEASLRGAPLWAVHIWPGSAHAETPSGPQSFAQARDEADGRLVDALQAWSEKYPEVVVHRVVRHGLDVPVALTAASKIAQLIVVGSANNADPAQRRPWVSGALVHRAGCCVAVVPAE